MEAPPFPLESLIDDLLIIVFERLNELSPESLRSCTGVCHRFYRLAVPIFYRDHIILPNSSQTRRVQRLLRHGSSLPLFARLAIFDDKYLSGSDDAITLIRFVRAAKNLKKIKYLGSFHMSEHLLQEINTLLPHVKLYVESSIPYNYADDGLGQGYESWGQNLDGMRGFSSPQLHSFRIGRPFLPLEHEVIKRCVSNIVKSCFNLREVEGDPEDTRGNYHCDITSADMLPRLERLAFVPFSIQNLKTWTATAGWATLTVLKVNDLNFLPVLSGQVPSLRCLVLYLTRFSLDWMTGLPEFEAPLKMLSISKLLGPFPLPFINQFTNTLEELSVNTAARDYNQLGDVQELKTICPRLKRLFISILLDEYWPFDVLDELASFEELTELIIRHKGNTYCSTSCALPEVTSSTCVRMFDYIQKRKSGAPLSLLGFHDGKFIEYADDFADIADRSHPCYTTTAAGNVSLRNTPDEYQEYEVRQKIEAQMAPLSKEGRPFSRVYPYATVPEDILWLAKKLGPGPGWAVRELLSAGLMTEEQLRWDWSSYSTSLIQPSAWEDKSQRNRNRQLVKEELIYWNRRWNFEALHGKDCTLYDILYPRQDDSTISSTAKC